MSSPADRIRRIVLGVVLGSLCGFGFGPCLFVLVFVICTVDGGGFNSLPKHKWVENMVNNATPGILILAPLAGCVVGVIWALRWNRRDEIKNPGSPP